MNQSELNTNRFRTSKALEITQMGLMIAIVCVATMSIKIPTMIGFFHLGDSMLFLAAILFGKKKGFVIGAIGMSMADFLLGYSYYVPFTFIIKGVMALIVATMAYRNNYNGKNILNNLFAFLVSGVWMVSGYFVAKVILVRFVLFKADNINNAIAIGLAGIPKNIVQVTIATCIAVPLVYILHGKLSIKSR